MKDPRHRLTRSWRTVGFRLLAVGVGVFPFALLELVLRLAGVATPPAAIDPFVQIAASGPLFERSPDGLMHVAPSRRICFRDQPFANPKPPHTFRAFCLGGSTVHGHPFSIETSFPAWLELALASTQPDVRPEFINCGGISYASYRLAPILEEVSQYQPDLIILMTGHNEFLEARAYPHHWRWPRPLQTAARLLGRSRILGLARAAFDRGRQSQAAWLQNRPILPEEVDALLDYRGGLEAFQDDPAFHEQVAQHFAFNLNRMVAHAQARGIPVLLIVPPSNLETPPFKAQFSNGLDPAIRAQAQRLWDQALATLPRDPAGPARLLEQAADLDPRHAAIQYDRGLVLARLGETSRAIQAFQQARDHDLCPLRITAPLERVIRACSRRHAVPLLDAQALFAARSPQAIVGDALLVDHVHPSITGHQILAQACLDLMVAHQWSPPPPSGWQTAWQASMQERLASLPPIYFLKAQQRLDNLEDWARGRATRDRASGSIAAEWRERRQRNAQWRADHSAHDTPPDAPAAPRHD